MDSLLVGIFSFILTFNVLCASTDTEIIDKRSPGWGKREAQTDETSLEDFAEPAKRRPGWGKRDSTNFLDAALEKRRPGWGKRSDILDRLSLMKRRPGWGKRSMSDLSEMDKRRPGWGKRDFPEDIDVAVRAPGWGKRSMIDDGEYSVYDKRRPGWGKRSDNIEVETRRPGWGKRAPGWGKRSSLDVCVAMKEKVDYLINSAIQVRQFYFYYSCI